MDCFKHKAHLEKKLRNEIELLIEQSIFVKVLATFDGGWSSDYISEKFIERYGNKYKIYKPENPPYPNYHTVFDDIWIFGEILKEKACKVLGVHTFNDNSEFEDHTFDAVSQMDVAIRSGFFD
jgi:hypothetical protein